MVAKKTIKQTNDDTKTKLGDIYHYYIVLLHCLELEEHETIYIEKFGDIAVASDMNSKNIEVKHHDGVHTLNDRNIDFWKSLHNWVKYHHNMKDFKQLILYTTSTFDTKNKLHSWNSIKAYERLSILLDIGIQNKKNEEGFRPLFTKIFDNDIEVILSILEKMQIYTNQSNVTSIEKKILSNSFFKSIKKSDRPQFVNNLMGYILTLPVGAPHKWEITCEDFESLACEMRDRYTITSGGLQLPPNTPDGPNDKDQYNNKRFVQQIKDIKYDIRIPKAIDNYWRTQQAIYYSCIDNPIFNIDLGEFQRDINGSLVEFKLSFQDECDETDVQDVIYKSKRLYDKAMEMPVTDYHSVKPNQAYFQRGIIHKVVEERGFSWNVTK